MRWEIGGAGGAGDATNAVTSGRRLGPAHPRPSGARGLTTGGPFGTGTWMSAATCREDCRSRFLGRASVAALNPQ
jgi:hypothetical protein